MYQLNFIEEQCLLEVTFSGFWTMETVTAFQSDMTALMAKYARRFPRFGMLSDSRGLSLMSKEVSEAFGQGTRVFAQWHRGRVAIVVETSLKKLQAQHITSDHEPRFFTDVGEARRWLLNGEGNAAESR